MVRSIGYILVALLLALARQAAGQDRPDDEVHQKFLGEQVDYLADIKPLLVRRCYTCHGPDGDTRKAELRFDDRADVVRPRYGDDGIVIPGNASESELFLRISSDDEELRMPPDGEPLSPEEIRLIRNWIEQGASYDEHWSFEPVLDPQPPVLPPDFDRFVRDPIDNFILNRIDAAGLRVSGDAPPAAQLRRLSFDLTGLPPSVEDVARFESDPGDETWNLLVEQYLESDEFGERWARHWLDLMRYAETYGHEYDYPIHDAWQYRDYVIRAFNDDVPYDRFLKEHVAGDLIGARDDPATGINQSPLATGFWHLHQAVHGPVDVRADELERVDNQIDVLTKAFLGMTVSCARCHDHKFDPILQSDYYGLAGYLKSSRRARTYIDPHGEIEESVGRIIAARELHDAVMSDASLSADDSELEQLLVTMADAMVAGDHPGAISTEVLLEDFEGQDFAGWEAEGNAFARGPQSPDTVRSAFDGHVLSRCVNTCDDRPGGNGDDDTGMLTSAPFLIEHPVLRFSLSGGKFPGETCLELIVDEDVVQMVHGQGDVTMRPVELDLSEWIGREARIRIVDKRTGPWGHIVVDDIRFGRIPGYAGAFSMDLAELRERTGLDDEGVGAWTRALHGSPDPTRPWHVPMGTGPEPEVVLDDGSGSEHWFIDGHAWPDDATPALHSGLVDVRLMGTARSRTFDIEHEHVIVRVRGSGTVRLIVNGFMMDQFNPLLFEGLKRDINGQQWELMVMDASEYIGQRGWIELIDDRNQGALEVDWIVLDDRPEARLTAGDDVASTSWSDREVQRWLVLEGLLESLPPSATELGQALQAEQDLPRNTVSRMASPQRALVMQDGFTEEESILLRGDHAMPAGVASRGLLEFLSEDIEVDESGSGRAKLAELMLTTGNRLTSRVMVNRMWHHLMGSGIVRTTDDFGGLGSMPTHPMLLDHLATDFARDYSIKRMIRRIVTSSAYRRSSDPADDAWLEIDPSNELLSHARIRRLQGEAIRDAMLKVSGRLDPKLHGRPVPIHLTPFMAGRGRPGNSGPVDGDGRRSIYLEVRRNFPVPFLAVFDLPVPSSTIGTRNVSNVPAQSLALMNDPFVHEMSLSWARKSMDHDDCGVLWREAFSRAATPEELEQARAFLEEGGGDQAAWVSLCHSLMNAKEFTHLN